MKNFILFLIIFILSALLLMSIRACDSERKDKNRTEETLRQVLKNGPVAPLAPIRVIRDTVFGTPISTYSPTIIAADDDLSSGGISPSYVDSISRALDVAQKSITDLTKANVTLNARMKLIVQELDSTGRLWAAYKDQSFDVKYYLDSNEADIKATVGLNLIGRRDRDNIFQQWKYYADAWTTDERFEITNVNIVRREMPKRSRLGIDFFAGPAYTPEGFKPLVFGIGLTYGIIEF